MFYFINILGSRKTKRIIKNAHKVSLLINFFRNLYMYQISESAKPTSNQINKNKLLDRNMKYERNMFKRTKEVEERVNERTKVRIDKFKKEKMDNPTNVRRTKYRNRQLRD